MAMTEGAMAEATWYSLSADDVVARLEADADAGLDADEVQRRLAQLRAE